VCRYFRNYLTEHDFVEIHTPKIISGEMIRKIFYSIFFNYTW
jgi:aspartyl/asparaginyl-tRNA synthetase